MTTPPTLFERTVVQAHRTRAHEGNLFLHDIAIEEVHDRLAMVNRTFKSVAVVTPFPDLWRDRFPGATFIADDETLTLKEADFDLVVHAMCLHWANDPVGQLIQCRRALAPDGLFLGVLLGGQTLSELRSALSQAEIQVSGGLSPRVVPMAEIRDLGALLQRAGFALPVADNLTTKVRYRDMTHLMHDLRAMGETNALSNRLRRPTRRAVFEQAQTLYQAAFGTDDGRIIASFEMICLTGWAPADTQPKPLRPGSAQARLADALGAKETKLPD
jgi:SAM-dependent methyltransferase